jgi:hypothetical protein
MTWTFCAISVPLWKVFGQKTRESARKQTQKG